MLGHLFIWALKLGHLHGERGGLHAARESGAGVAEPGVRSAVPATVQVQPRTVEVPETLKSTVDCAAVEALVSSSAATRAMPKWAMPERDEIFTTDISALLRNLGATARG